jgi:hypothetical protein
MSILNYFTALRSQSGLFREDRAGVPDVDREMLGLHRERDAQPELHSAHPVRVIS